MKKITQLLILFQCLFMFAQVEQTITIGTGTSSSATRGPFQRSSSSSSSVFSRASLHYSQAELAGLTSTSTITQINFDLGSTNTITASGDATMLVYMKNSTATEVVADPSDWSDIINGATLVGTYTFNTTNNFPGAEGFLSFELDADFDYTGDALEIAIDWDCSNLVPVDAMQPNALFSGNGSLNWHWSPTTQSSLSYRSGSSSAPSTITGNRKTERVNTQIVFTDPNALQTLTLGTGTSSSATRGPFQRSSSSSSSVYSRASLHYTQAELASLTSSATISQINFDLGSTNIITASGNATMLVYMRNTSTTEVVADPSDWNDIINGATLVGAYTFNTTNNFPGAEGFLNFGLDTEFEYTGGALEIAVDWDCSNLVPVDAGQPNALFSGNGSLNWHWSATAQRSLSYRSGSSSAPSTITGNRKSERVNTEIVYKILDPLSIDDNTFSSKFQLSPNPSLDYVTVRTVETIDSIEIYDMTGKRVNAIVSGNTVNVSSLASAVYLVKISSGNAVAVKRLIKQ